MTSKKPFTAVLIGLMILAGRALAADPAPAAAAPPEMPKPRAEHAWLQQLVGEWESESEMYIDAETTMKGKGSESARSLGGFWVVTDGKATVDGIPGEAYSLLTLGFDAEKGHYIGTWVDSVTGYRWDYVGSMDATGKVLTLDTKGSCPMLGGKIANVREVITIVDEDHKTFTSSMQGDDGKWIPMLKVESRRKK